MNALLADIVLNSDYIGFQIFPAPGGKRAEGALYEIRERGFH